MKNWREDTLLACALLAVLAGIGFYLALDISSEVFERWKNFSESIFYLVSTVLLIFGASQWRREHTGKMRLELAQDITKATYELKEAMYDFRRGAHIGFPYEGNQIERSRHFDSSIEGLFEKVANLRKLTPSVQATFSDTFEKTIEPLVEHVYQLRSAARIWAMGKEQGSTSPEVQRSYKICVNQTRFSDEFDKEVESTVESINKKFLTASEA